MLESIRQSKSYNLIYRLLETLFLALAGLYLFYRTSRITTFGLDWPSGFEKKLLVVMAVAALLRLLSTPLKRKKTLIALGIALIYYLVYRSDGYRFLLYLAVLTVGFIDIDYRKILKVYLVAVGVVYCAAVLAGMMGVITNYVYTRSGRGLRSAWGIGYTTDFASLAFFLLMALWVIWRKLPDWAMLLLCAGFILMSRFIAYSWNAVICGAALFLCILYRVFERRVINRNRGLRWIKKGVNLCATLAFPFFALCIFALMLIYARGMNIGYRLDHLLSKRPSLAVEVWRQNGMTLFGTPFTMHGNGGSTFPTLEYSFVDSSYPLILLRYGWVLTIAICLIWCWMTRKAIHIGNRRLMMVLALVAMHSFAEHHFIECHYNILLVMPLAAFPAPDKSKNASLRERASTRVAANAVPISSAACAITILLCVLSAWLAAPAALSGIRTTIEALGLCADDTGWGLLVVMVALLSFAGVTVWSIYNISACLFGHSTPRKFKIALQALLICVCVGAAGWLFADKVIENAAAEEAATVKADREALEIAIEAATGKVYSGVLPCVYLRSIDGLSYSAFFEDDLARHYQDTVLLPTDRERSVYVLSGFLYTQISDTHALYSADRAVINALMNAGYHVTGYYSTLRQIDLSQAAKLNKVTYDEDAGLLLKGRKRTLNKGPYFNLYGGKYTVTYELTLPKREPRDNTVICTLSVTSDKGKNTLVGQEVTGAQFNEDGKLSINLTFDIWHTRNVSFHVDVKKHHRIGIEGIGFVLTPDSDIHKYYDAKLRPVREEYYDLEGKKSSAYGGYFACEYEYDSRDNVTDCRYYDTDDRLFLYNNDFAALHRVYDARNQVLREEYYDMNGDFVLNLSGYAMSEMEYDSAGNMTRVRFYNTEGKPVVIADGYAELLKTYDNLGRILSEEYLGADGTLLSQAVGCAGIVYEYDSENSASTTRYYDEQEKPVVTTMGYAGVRRTYDADGYVVQEAYFDTADRPMAQVAGHCGIEQEYDEGHNLLTRRYLDAEGTPTQRIDGYSEVCWTYDTFGRVIKYAYFDADGRQIDDGDINLAIDVPYEWSAWMTPRRDRSNITYNIGYLMLGDKSVGDAYTCQVEIEFSNVRASEDGRFGFWSQGAVDHQWNGVNIWNGNLAYYRDVPDDGIYCYTVTQTIGEDIEKASVFNLGFRCDYWANGSFRVRRMKIEKGSMASVPSPGA